MLPNSTASLQSQMLSLRTRTEAARPQWGLGQDKAPWLCIPLEGQQDLQGSGPAGQWVRAEHIQKAPSSSCLREQQSSSLLSKTLDTSCWDLPIGHGSTGIQGGTCGC